MLGGFVSIEHGTQGPNLSSVTACAAGTHAISEAVKTIICNGAEKMLVVSAESAITGVGIGGFAAHYLLYPHSDRTGTHGFHLCGGDERRRYSGDFTECSRYTG